MASTLRSPSLDSTGYVNGGPVTAADTSRMALPGTIENDVPATPSVTPGNAWSSLTGAIEGNTGGEAVLTVDGSGDVVPYIRASNFGFSVPTDCTIVGVAAHFRTGNASRQDKFNKDELKLAWGASAATLSTGNKFTGASGHTYQHEWFGGPTDLWGETAGTITPAIVNSTDFGLVAKISRNDTASGGTNNAEIDAMNLAVYFTLGSTNGDLQLTQLYVEVLGSIAEGTPPSTAIPQCVIVT